jgi:hypothetical protein
LENEGNDVTVLNDVFRNQTSNVISDLWGTSGANLLEENTVFDNIRSSDQSRTIEYGGFTLGIVKNVRIFNCHFTIPSQQGIFLFSPKAIGNFTFINLTMINNSFSGVPLFGFGQPVSQLNILNSTFQDQMVQPNAIFISLK